MTMCVPVRDMKNTADFTALVEQEGVVLDHFGYWDFSYNLSCLNSRRKRRSSYGHQG